MWQWASAASRARVATAAPMWGPRQPILCVGGGCGPRAARLPCSLFASPVLGLPPSLSMNSSPPQPARGAPAAPICSPRSEQHGVTHSECKVGKGTSLRPHVVGSSVDILGGHRYLWRKAARPHYIPTELQDARGPRRWALMSVSLEGCWWGRCSQDCRGKKRGHHGLCAARLSGRGSCS